MEALHLLSKPARERGPALHHPSWAAAHLDGSQLTESVLIVFQQRTVICSTIPGGGKTCVASFPQEDSKLCLLVLLTQ